MRYNVGNSEEFSNGNLPEKRKTPSRKLAQENLSTESNDSGRDGVLLLLLLLL
jgi:hypothetical protein